MNSTLPYILNGEFFEIIAQDGESVTVRCCYCDGGRNIYRGSVKSTGNFHMHIKRKHPGLIEKVRESKVKAYLARKSLQQDRKSNIKRRYIKRETVHYPVHALNLKTNPGSRNDDVRVKYEASMADNNRFVRNIFSTAISQALQQTQLAESPELHSPEVEQTEPTDLSRHSAHREVVIQNDNILPRIESALMSIEREMRLRNQIESNRLFLELAKFKYINPDFQFRF